MRAEDSGYVERLYGGLGRATEFDRYERIVHGVDVAVWYHSHASRFGTLRARRVCQAWFGARIGPVGMFGQARRTLDQRLKRLAGTDRRWYVIDREPTRTAVLEQTGLRIPRYFALTATDPNQVVFWLSPRRIDGLMHTVATTLTPFDARVLTRPRFRMDDRVVRNLVTTARVLI